MGTSNSGYALTLIENQDLISAVRGILDESSIRIYSGDSSLSSASALDAKLRSEGNLSFLKRDLLGFISENGYPFITIIEIANTGEDRFRVLKTLLLSWIIIMQSEQYRNIFCNLLILIDSAGYRAFKERYRQPQSIFGMIKTGDERINSIISEYITDIEKFKKNFNILITNSGQDISLVRSEIVLFINMIKAREKLLEKLAAGQKPQKARPLTEAAEAADVLIRVGGNIYRNGDSIDSYSDNQKFPEREIFILGNYTSYTRLKVNGRLIKIIREGFGEDYSFSKTDSVIINIPPESTIDTTIPVTLTQLLLQELKDYKNIRIKVPSKHYRAMQESKGFSLIQRNLIIHEN